MSDDLRQTCENETYVWNFKYIFSEHTPECDFKTHECDFHTPECDFHMHDCVFDTLEGDLYT
jgi:hypothetical protein